MTDNKHKRGKPDSIQINFHEPYEIAYWTTKWKVSEQQLRDAHRATGSVAVKKIEAYLKEEGLLH